MWLLLAILTTLTISFKLSNYRLEQVAHSILALFPFKMTMQRNSLIRYNSHFVKQINWDHEEAFSSPDLFLNLKQLLTMKKTENFDEVDGAHPRMQLMAANLLRSIMREFIHLQEGKSMPLISINFCSHFERQCCELSMCH